MKSTLFAAILAGAAFSLVGCEDKKSPTAGGAPAGGAPSAIDAAKAKAGEMADSLMKQKDELVASANKKIEEFAKGAEGWKSKIDALPAAAKEPVTKLVDTFNSSMTSAKSAVGKLKDSTSANYADLSKAANDSIAKLTESYNAVKSKLGL